MRGRHEHAVARAAVLGDASTLFSQHRGEHQVDGQIVAAEQQRGRTFGRAFVWHLERGPTAATVAADSR